MGRAEIILGHFLPFGNQLGPLGSHLGPFGNHLGPLGIYPHLPQMILDLCGLSNKPSYLGQILMDFIIVPHWTNRHDLNLNVTQPHLSQDQVLMTYNE